MKIQIDLTKTVSRNAQDYYERSKKARKKLKGLLPAIERTKKQLEKKFEQKTVKKKVKRERDWYEKLHWAHSSDGFLIIAGRDAKTNEQIVKRHMNKDDLFFHADIQGAAATIIIADSKKIPERTKQEAATLAACFSKAWTVGLGAVDVYSVTPENVKTAAKPGEFLAKGSFVIRGKREWYRKTELAIKIAFDKRPFITFSKGIEIRPGKMTKSDLAKLLEKKLKCDRDELLQVIPQGGVITD